MDQQIEIRTVEVRQRPTRTGKMSYVIKDVDGYEYSTLDPQMAGQFGAGRLTLAMVDVVTSAGRQYNNIVGVVGASFQAPQASPKPPTAPERAKRQFDPYGKETGLAKACTALYVACYEYGDNFEVAKNKVDLALAEIAAIQSGNQEIRVEDVPF